MDTFTRNALIGCAIVCGLILALFYVGSALGYTGMEGTDSKVEGQAAQSGNKEGRATFYELNQNEEYVAFLLAGMGGGFVVGYAWTMIFDETHRTGGTPPK